ncbi:MAG: hypothetical protein ACTSYL_10385 [Candidatus Thorarchaeota archaeon]
MSKEITKKKIEEIDFDKLEQDVPEEFRSFVRRVRDDDVNGPYEEDNHYSLWMAVVGAALLAAGGIYLGFIFLENQSTPVDMMLFMFIIIGGPMLIGGTSMWVRIVNARKFYGLKRSELSDALFQLDAYESGGMEYGLGEPPIEADKLIRNLNAPTGYYDKVLTKKSCEHLLSEFKYGVPILFGMLIFSLFVLRSASDLVSATIGYSVLLLFCILSFAATIDFMRLKHRLRRIKSDKFLSVSGETIQVVSDILTLLGREYKFPLRLGIFRIYDDLIYTGREYKRDGDYTEYEALFIPSVPRQ